MKAAPPSLVSRIAISINRRSSGSSEEIFVLVSTVIRCAYEVLTVVIHKWLVPNWRDPLQPLRALGSTRRGVVVVNFAISTLHQSRVLALTGVECERAMMLKPGLSSSPFRINLNQVHELNMQVQFCVLCSLSLVQF
ncbi:hypothetical protein MA16_Dca027292 [Dendrobium catenatum]|uniref:Uncharacterized protein n=1 Tax=Dendrobium catenatum TaxID=906689 RepID=A0A2I0V7C4_9ASPA|nr:hypothetical protein MA16_Dca027292 [Dendrobium catenatum]